MKQTFFLFSLIIILSCSREESEYVADTGVLANYSFFFRVNVSEGGTVTCYPKSVGIGKIGGLNSNQQTACRVPQDIRGNGVLFKVGAGSQALLEATPDEGYYFLEWSNGSKESVIVVNMDDYITEISAYFESIQITQ